MFFVIIVRKVFSISVVSLFTCATLFNFVAEATKYVPSKDCIDDKKVCVMSGMKIVDGFEVSRDCWEWQYIKKCSFPSKNNCAQYSHCYFVQYLPCILKDFYGNCVNLHKEFSCKSWHPTPIESQHTRYALTEKEGVHSIVCGNIKCIDGNCVDKSYITDGDMMDSVSKLYTVSQINPDKYGNFSLFQGTHESCSKKMAQYTNCCSVRMGGWGSSVGANCTKNERELMEMRQKELCVYVGKEDKRNMGVTTMSKHHFCCFPSILHKVIQVEGRKQLQLSFGNGGNANCRGLTLEEIQRLDFSKIDFSEFIRDLQKKFGAKYKTIDPAHTISKIQYSKDKKMRTYKPTVGNKENNLSGWSSDMRTEDLEMGSDDE